MSETFPEHHEPPQELSQSEADVLFFRHANATFNDRMFEELRNSNTALPPEALDRRRNNIGQPYWPHTERAYFHLRPLDNRLVPYKVEQVKKQSQVLGKKVVGYVMSVEDVPEKDAFRIARVYIGEREDDGSMKFKNIMWGGEERIGPGDSVVVALPGAKILRPDGKQEKLRVRNYLGGRIKSEGMLCSKVEAGLQGNSDTETMIGAQASVYKLPPGKYRAGEPFEPPVEAIYYKKLEPRKPQNLEE